MRKRLPVVVSFAIVACSIAAVGITQEQPKRNAPATTKPANPAQTGDRQHVDEHLAGCLAIDNQKEIAMAQLAHKKSTNDEVREFAEMMIADHSKFLKKLDAYVPELTRDNLLAGSRGDDSAAVRRDEDQPSRKDPPQKGTAASQAGSADKGLQIKLEVARECLRSAQADLSKKNDSEFDNCFMTAQVLAHKEMAVALKIFERHASPELAKLIKEAQTTTMEHLEHAEKLAKQTEETYIRTASREGRAKE